MAELTATLQQSQLRGQIHAQEAQALQDKILAERRLPTTPSLSPFIAQPQSSIPAVLNPSPATAPPPSAPSLDFFASMRDSAGGDPMQAGGDSTRKMPSAPPGGNPYSAARGDPSVHKARGDPSEETVPSAPFPAQVEQEQRPRTPPGFETKMPKMHTPPGQIFV